MNGPGLVACVATLCLLAATYCSRALATECDKLVWIESIGTYACAQMSHEDPTLNTAEYEGEVIYVAEIAPHLNVHLPNLRVQDVDVNVFGDVRVTIENVGPADSPQVNVVVSVVGRGNSVTAFPPMPPGGEHTAHVMTFDVSDLERDLVVTVGAIVDPGPISRPGGDVWESREDDNRRYEICVIYGPNPDLGSHHKQCSLF